ncbi:hypothetical protein EMCG_08221 [[Emmonsia] crescens]|uniref:DUF7025 domain-containing protein n=1 Tax=[Emmonsia] crescens TaxID=73230 RepID=A0A0G2I5X1_9EURO|nr:hypothetical protein EMCG_08221 [Emmonsia crescens UAMH 3008]
MEQLQSTDCSEPIEDTKPEKITNKERSEGRARASKLEYKEVYEVWDKENSKYKIVDPAREDKALDDLDHYIFVVRERVSDRMVGETKTLVDIKSKPLLDALQEIVTDVRAISLCDDKPSDQIERNFLYTFLPDLEEYITTKGRNHEGLCSKHVDLLIKYIKDTYAFTTQILSSLLKKGEITYDLLWTIFKPGVFVYSTCLRTGNRCVIFDAGEERTKRTGIKYFSLDCHYLDFDGVVFGEARTQLEVVQFRGPRRIDALAAFPLDHHPKKSDAMRSLINCGRNFCDLKGQHIRHYCGLAFFKVRGEMV